jgi:hypothetical protein
VEVLLLGALIICTFGDMDCISVKLAIFRSSIVDSVIAVIAIGASCKDSSLLEAVTTTSSIPPDEPIEPSES